MPERPVIIRAMCQDSDFELVLDNGDGDGEYSSGTSVTITADPCPAGKEFDQWDILAGSADIEDIHSPTTTLIMPDSFAQVIVSRIENRE